MNVVSFNISVQGASHIKKNKECQDYSDSFYDDSCAVAVVCDGHGGDDYIRSAIGAEMGCKVACENIKDFISNIELESLSHKSDQHLKTLEASIISGWNESVKKYHDEHPFTEAELSAVSEKAKKKYLEGRIESAYGTTLIAVAICEKYWIGLHIGDGKCIAINTEGSFKQPIPWDEKCFLNATTSICDSDAIDRFRHFFSEKLPAAVFVGSDGIDDCFKNNEQLNNLYKTMLYSFATTEFGEAVDGLKDYLPRLSAKGSGDDVSVAAILDMDIIPELTIVKEFDRDKEKARVEENARIEAEKNEEEKRRVEEEHARFQKENSKNKIKSKPSGRLIRYCDNCGERIKPGAKYCNSCGNKIDYDDVDDNEKQQIVELAETSNDELILPGDISETITTEPESAVLNEKEPDDLQDELADIESDAVESDETDEGSEPEISGENELDNLQDELADIESDAVESDETDEGSEPELSDDESVDEDGHDDPESDEKTEEKDGIIIVSIEMEPVDSNY